jgi:hypothetical protein
MWYAISMQRLIELILMEGNVTSQQYLQQLQTEIILVILEAQHGNMFFQQKDMCPYIVNVTLASSMMCLVAVPH